MWGTTMKVAAGALCGAALTAGVAVAAIPGADGKIKGSFVSSGLRPYFTPKAQYHGLDKLLTAAMT